MLAQLHYPPVERVNGGQAPEVGVLQIDGDGLGNIQIVEAAHELPGRREEHLPLHNVDARIGVDWMSSMISILPTLRAKKTADRITPVNMPLARSCVATVSVCFGTQGMVALTLWFGSLYADQIRSAHKSFPFLEATGEAGAGKTTLLTFLWKLLGRSDYESFDPAKSSKAGRARAMGQISDMPVVLLEADRSDADRSHAKSFQWDEWKDYYSGGTLATRGVRNGGNDTYEPPFRDTIVISQNAAVDASEAVLTRIVKLHFRKLQVTTESRIAADNLNALQVQELIHSLIRAARAESQVMEEFRRARASMRPSCASAGNCAWNAPSRTTGRCWRCWTPCGW